MTNDRDELVTWFYYLLGSYEGRNGSVKNHHPALAEFVERLEKGLEDATR